MHSLQLQGYKCDRGKRDAAFLPRVWSAVQGRRLQDRARGTRKGRGDVRQGAAAPSPDRPGRVPRRGCGLSPGDVGPDAHPAGAAQEVYLTGEDIGYQYREVCQSACCVSQFPRFVIIYIFRINGTSSIYIHVFFIYMYFF